MLEASAFEDRRCSLNLLWTLHARLRLAPNTFSSLKFKVQAAQTHHRHHRLRWTEALKHGAGGLPLYLFGRALGGRGEGPAPAHRPCKQRSSAWAMRGPIPEPGRG